MSETKSDTAPSASDRLMYVSIEDVKRNFRPARLLAHTANWLSVAALAVIIATFAASQNLTSAYVVGVLFVLRFASNAWFAQHAMSAKPLLSNVTKQQYAKRYIGLLLAVQSPGIAFWLFVAAVFASPIVAVVALALVACRIATVFFSIRSMRKTLECSISVTVQQAESLKSNV